METVVVSARLPCAHRLPGTDGHCRFLHGVTWRASVAVTMPTFASARIDTTALAASLRDVLDVFDHRMLVAGDDPMVQHLAAGNTGSVIVIPGRAPTVENLARHVASKAAASVATLARVRGPACSVVVTLSEGDSAFEVRRDIGL